MALAGCYSYLIYLLSLSGLLVLGLFPEPGLLPGLGGVVPATTGGVLGALPTSGCLELVRHLVRLGGERLECVVIGERFTHRIGPSHPQLEIEVVESVGLGARWVLGLGDLVEEARSLVDPVLTDVDVLLPGSHGSSPTEGRRIGDPALAPDGV